MSMAVPADGPHGVTVLSMDDPRLPIGGAATPATPPSVPDAGADVGEFLRSVARRLSAHPFHPDDHQTQMVLADLHCLLGLAWYSLLDPHGARADRRRWEQHLAGVVQLRVLETDTAVDLALADLRRERGE